MGYASTKRRTNKVGKITRVNTGWWWIYCVLRFFGAKRIAYRFFSSNKYPKTYWYRNGQAFRIEWISPKPIVPRFRVVEREDEPTNPSRV